MGNRFKTKFSNVVKDLRRDARKAAGKLGEGAEDAGKVVEAGVRDAARGAKDAATAVAREVKEVAEK